MFERPRIREWLGTFIALRKAGRRVSSAYIAAKLTKGGRLEGVLAPDETITESNVRRYLWERSVAEGV